MSGRIYEEYKYFSIHPMINLRLTVGLINESYYDWKFTFSGAKETPYDKGLFFLEAHFPSDYPNSPPEINFITPIYHMNVNPIAPKEKGGESLGHVRISILSCWKPQYKMKEVLLNIYSLFYMFNPNRAYGKEIVKEYEEDECIYFEKAKYFTKKYANSHDKNIFCKRNEDWDFNI